MLNFATLLHSTPLHLVLMYNVPRKTLADFPKPPLYGRKDHLGQNTELVMFGFPLNEAYMLDFVNRHNILPNADEARRISNGLIQLGLAVKTELDASFIALKDDGKYNKKSLDFAIVIASNRTRSRLNRMNTYPHFERLARFLGLPPCAATWVFPQDRSSRAARILKEERNRII
ncbi:hypothetical protein NLJ89_g9051 [Agrocybe chaxingu]|uniref:Uncharacterized protein n=1 Tax=Agrocybe chaxingu TaxID=84603 RepID=A0A9W8MS72_9AGAR|nr:hypothetical protein NLJ89_g9051 [Agrocybe chaxingu]